MGYVYVLIHPIQDGYVKIGQTKLSPDERARQLTNQCGTGLAGKYIVAYKYECDNPEYLESIVHARLEGCRVTSCREFFECNVESAIDTIRETVEQLKTQTKVDFNSKSRSIWWNSLTPPWKQVFRGSIHVKLTPEKEQLMEGIFNIISYCRDKDIRESVADSIKDNKDFSKKIEKWYAKLGDKQRAKVNSFLPITPNKNELKRIQNSETIDCSGNLLIENLLPINSFTNLKTLNCSNTSITTLAPIKELFDLEEIKFNITDVNSLEPLMNLKKLKNISCNQTALSETEIKRFKGISPECKVFTAL